MSTMLALRPTREPELDQRVVLYGMGWKAYEVLLALRGEAPGPRLYYLDGAIEILSASREHEFRKKTLARLLEHWALHEDVELSGFGSFTLKNAPKEAGAEADECYTVGSEDKDVPDLVIEVEFSRALGLPKLEIYRRLGVRETWTLTRDARLVVRVLERGRYVEHPRSKVLPTLDVPWLFRFASMSPQSRAVRALRDALRKPRGRGRDR